MVYLSTEWADFMGIEKWVAAMIIRLEKAKQSACHESFI